MNDMQELEILTQCFSHRELARIYLVSLKERDRLVEELKQCKADRDAAIAGQETLQKACAVKHGYWFDVGSLSCRCSRCGCKNNKESRYCPTCGSKMDAEKGRL